MNRKQLAEVKRTLTEGRTKVKAMVGAKGANEEYGASKLLADWQAFIDDDTKLEKLARVEGFQSICAIGSKLSSKQTYPQLMNTAAGSFAEVDLADHLVREFPGLSIKKLPEVPDVRQADFEVERAMPLFVESKYVLSPTPSRLKSVITSAVEQLVATGSYHGHTQFNGTGWVVSYKEPEGITSQELQTLVECIQNDLSSHIPGDLKVTFQVYDRGLYGKCAL